MSSLPLSLYCYNVLPRRQDAATVLLGPSSKEEEDHGSSGFQLQPCSNSPELEIQTGHRCTFWVTK